MKKKLALNDLKVQSFVTTKGEVHQAKGGYDPFSRPVTKCNPDNSFGTICFVCPPFPVLQAQA